MNIHRSNAWSRWRRIYTVDRLDIEKHINTHGNQSSSSKQDKKGGHRRDMRLGYMTPIPPEAMQSNPNRATRSNTSSIQVGVMQPRISNQKTSQHDRCMHQKAKPQQPLVFPKAAVASFPKAVDQKAPDHGLLTSSILPSPLTYLSAPSNWPISTPRPAPLSSAMPSTLTFPPPPPPVLVALMKSAYSLPPSLPTFPFLSSRICPLALLSNAPLWPVP